MRMHRAKCGLAKDLRSWAMVTHRRHPAAQSVGVPLPPASQHVSGWPSAGSWLSIGRARPAHASSSRLVFAHGQGHTCLSRDFLGSRGSGSPRTEHSPERESESRPDARHTRAQPVSFVVPCLTVGSGHVRSRRLFVVHTEAGTRYVSTTMSGKAPNALWMSVARHAGCGVFLSSPGLFRVSFSDLADDSRLHRRPDIG